jgi:opacity protein-like surface antigen
MKRLLSVLAAIVVGGAVGAPSRVSAEGFLDLYIGGAFTQDSSLDFEISPFPDFSVPAEWNSSFAGGIRGGYWFQGRAKWLGLAGDLSYFQADVATADVANAPPVVSASAVESFTFHLVPISPLVMLRIPLLTGDGFDGGRLQPYGAIGPGLIVSILTNDAVSGAEVGFNVGLDARVGVTAMLTPLIGLFVEYRYTDVDVEITDSFDDKIKTSLQTNHVNGGLALRF